MWSRCTCQRIYVPMRTLRPKIMYRDYSTTYVLNSGHNKWSKIRHSKGAIDAERAKLFSRLSADISMAAKLGGPDPSSNIRLAACLANAKKADMPKVNIEAALKRASGRSADGQSEAIIYEATLGPVGLMIETLTDKKTRTIANLKAVLKKNGAAMSPCGFLFERIGNIVVAGKEQSLDDMLDVAIELEAEDVTSIDSDAFFSFRTAPSKLSNVATSLKNAGYEPLEVELQFEAKETIKLDHETQQQFSELVKLLENDQDVTKITTNV